MLDETDLFGEVVSAGRALDAAPQEAAEPAGAVRRPHVTGLPDGYVYGVTRYADVIVQTAFPNQWRDLVDVLEGFTIELAELHAGGGGRTESTKRFDEALAALGWGKRTITIGKTVDGAQLQDVRGHEIDMFSIGSDAEPYPGIAVEMEWNNKDPFYDRDLLNFQALHREGALAVGVIVTRGPALQQLLKHTLLGPGRLSKYGESSTHWNKLIPRVNLGGGGECPLLLIGIDPPRIAGVEVLRAAQDLFDEAAVFKAAWRGRFATWGDAKPVYDELMERGYAHLGV